MSIIEVENLTKVYRTKTKQPGLTAAIRNLFKNERSFTKAVDDISFNIEAGEIVGILGPNGAGKTTTLKVLSGLLYPTKGRVLVDNHIPWKRENDYKKKIGMLTGQKNQLIWDLSANDSFHWLKEIYQIPTVDFDRNVKKLAEILQVEDKLNVQLRRLSFGQRMKMEIIASLLHGPKVIFFDEPTIGLDITAQNMIHRFIKEYNQTRGTTFLLTSHNLSDIEKLCKHVIIIKDGEKSYDGSLESLLRSSFDHKVISVKLASGTLDYQSLHQNVSLVEQKEYNYLLRVPKASCQEIAGKLWANYDVHDLNVQDPEIGEVIENLFKS